MKPLEESSASSTPITLGGRDVKYSPGDDGAGRVRAAQADVEAVVLPQRIDGANQLIQVLGDEALPRLPALDGRKRLGVRHHEAERARADVRRNGDVDALEDVVAPVGPQEELERDRAAGGDLVGLEPGPDQLRRLRLLARLHLDADVSERHVLESRS